MIYVFIFLYLLIGFLVGIGGVVISFKHSSYENVDEYMEAEFDVAAGIVILFAMAWIILLFVGGLYFGLKMTLTGILKFFEKEGK